MGFKVLDLGISIIGCSIDLRKAITLFTGLKLSLFHARARMVSSITIITFIGGAAI